MLSCDAALAFVQGAALGSFVLAFALREAAMQYWPSYSGAALEWPYTRRWGEADASLLVRDDAGSCMEIHAASLVGNDSWTRR